MFPEMVPAMNFVDTEESSVLPPWWAVGNITPTRYKHVDSKKTWKEHEVTKKQRYEKNLLKFFVKWFAQLRWSVIEPANDRGNSEPAAKWGAPKKVGLWGSTGLVNKVRFAEVKVKGGSHKSYAVLMFVAFLDAVFGASFYCILLVASFSPCGSRPLPCGGRQIKVDAHVSAIMTNPPKKKGGRHVESHHSNPSIKMLEVTNQSSIELPAFSLSRRCATPTKQIWKSDCWKNRWTTQRCDGDLPFG